MIVLITDFGLEGPYVGQLQRVFLEQAPSVPVINLLADAPTCNPRATSYLLDAYTAGYAAGTVFLCIVDPGVGSGRHAPVAVNRTDCWYVGPDNGLFEIVRRRAPDSQTFRIEWRPPHLSASFHGRDLYAPVAARLASGDRSGLSPSQPLRFPEWPDDLPEVIYVDHYGNAMTGVRAAKVAIDTTTVELRGRRLRHAHTFAEVAQAEAFWYENSNGLLEIAANRGRADVTLSLRIGDQLKFVEKRPA
ncbi:MAG: SAM hydrolase/SAM-dependent halogenase family protein [Chromatiales bacterium]